MGEKCSFPFVTLPDVDVVISPLDVHNCELGTSTEESMT